MKSFVIPDIFKSNFISQLKEQRRVNDKLKKDFKPTVLSFSEAEILIARHFGFCYGVENAVEIAYKTLAENPDKKIYLLSEMIHNPEVNADLLSRGVVFLMDTNGKWLINISTLSSEDIVIVPAFGTTIEIQNQLSNLGINPYKYDTTCPFVEKVWNRAKQIGERGYTVVVHGKPNHEETRATFSHSREKTPTLIINDINEAKVLAEYITKRKNPAEFYTDFKGRFSEGFNPETDLLKLGVVNQTTMLASETQEISDYLKKVLTEFQALQGNGQGENFANMRDTLCYATNDNQDATYELLKHNADAAIVVGGYNSSNTSHIVELLESQVPTFFINSATCIQNNKMVSHYNIHTRKEELSAMEFLNKVKPRIILTCGASCPDAIVEKVLIRILETLKIDTNLAELNMKISW